MTTRTNALPNPDRLAAARGALKYRWDQQHDQEEDVVVSRPDVPYAPLQDCRNPALAADSRVKLCNALCAVITAACIPSPDQMT